MTFTKEIGSVLFDGYWKGGAGGNPKARAGKALPKPFEEAAQNFPYLLGKIKPTIVMTDYDSPEAFQARLRIAEALQQHCIAIKSPNKGGHIYWANERQTVKTSNSGNRTVLTLYPVDYKCGIKQVKSTGEVKASDNYGCLSKEDRTLREVVYCNLDENGGLDEVPFYDLSLEGKTSFLGMGNGSGRQEAVFCYMIPMKISGYTYEQFRTVAELANQYLFSEPLTDEFENAVRQEAWDSLDGELDTFGTGNNFQHNKFAAYLIEKYHIKMIDKQLHAYQNGVYVPGDAAIEKAMLDEIESLKKRQRSEVLDYLRLRAPVCKPCDFNFIAFANGIYDTETDTLIPFSPDIIITNRIPHNFNKSAVSPLVDSVLDKLSCNDKQVRYLLEEAAGACLYRSNTLGGGKMIVLLGDKANGKSTYIDMLKAMLGTENYSTLDPGETKGRFSTAMLYRKLANLGDDISDGYIADAAQLKKIITGNEIKAENKGQDPFTFEPYCTMIFSANDIPRIKDGTGAVQRRLLIVPMNATFTKEDPDYDPMITYKLQEEQNIEALIQLALTGLAEVLNHKGFTKPKRVKEQLDTYERENNPILGFIAECDVDADIINQETKLVYSKYEIYCSENGLIAGSKLTFSKRLNAALGTRTKDKRLPNGKKGIIFERCS